MCIKRSTGTRRGPKIRRRSFAHPFYLQVAKEKNKKEKLNPNHNLNITVINKCIVHVINIFKCAICKNFYFIYNAETFLEVLFTECEEIASLIKNDYVK